ncbi:MAG: phosphatidylserine decarboxylase family protein [Deltaproteobacteria bacterium]|nr:phosphatidylserine decarboxylase family protein [Deltaproteobacteria bacterium]
MIYDDYFKHKIPEFNINNNLLLARPGLPFVFLTGILFLIAWFFDWCYFEAIFFIFLAFGVMFYRDPNRNPPPPGFGVAPADGKIIRVDREAVCPITEAKSTKISIFMNVFNVHVNRVPVNARLDTQKYHAGTFSVASHDKASDKNERNSLVLIDEKERQITVVQIAGLLARRIESWVKPGEYLTRGQRFGMIRFGSRVDIYVPPEADIMVNIGQTVKAGWSPIFRFPD